MSSRQADGYYQLSMIVIVILLSPALRKYFILSISPVYDLHNYLMTKAASMRISEFHSVFIQIRSGSRVTIQSLLRKGLPSFSVPC